jgi:SAM-dependent methyltransferase
MFRDGAAWREIRLDVDPAMAPDILCSTVDMKRHVSDASVDALWSSHNIEHLYDHEVPLAFAEFRRVLKPDGFALFRCPDFEAVLEAIVANGLEMPAYLSPAGPIAPLDMIFGHRASVARGNTFMAHHTAFTDMRLARLLMEAGFSEIRTLRAPSFDLWAIAFGPEANIPACLDQLEAHGLMFDA